jgi:hypothetical protein
MVRGEARRLSDKLTDYYGAVGKDDSVFIFYRPGGYVSKLRTGYGVPAGHSGVRPIA